MPTVTKTFSFLTDAEGLADQAVSGVVFAHEAGDGNPLGSVKFTQATKSFTHTERARRNTTGETWETWGVPAGNIVTAVQITSRAEKTASVTKLTSHSISMRVVDSAGVSVHPAGDLVAAVNPGTTVDTLWQTITTGTVQRAVDAAKQASSTDVRLELEYSVTTGAGGGGAAVDQRFDQIVLTITHEAVTLTEVAKALQAVWHLRTPVAVARQLLFNVRAAITQSRQTLWNVRGPVTAAKQVIWQSRETVSQARQIVWNISDLVLVSKAILLFWNQRQGTARATELKWHQLARADKTLTLLFDVRTETDRSMSALWGIKENVGTDLAVSWTTFARLQQDLEVLWQTRSLTHKSVDLRWDLLTSVVADLTTIWDDLERAQRDLQAPWNVRQSLASELTIIWNAVGLLMVQTALQLIWNTRGLTARQLSLRWDLVSQLLELSKAAIGSPQLAWPTGQAVSEPGTGAGMRLSPGEAEAGWETGPPTT